VAPQTAVAGRTPSAARPTPRRPPRRSRPRSGHRNGGPLEPAGAVGGQRTIMDHGRVRQDRAVRPRPRGDCLGWGRGGREPGGGGGGGSQRCVHGVLGASPAGGVFGLRTQGVLRELREAGGGGPGAEVSDVLAADQAGGSDL
jgi:hypothetical protein